MAKKALRQSNFEILLQSVISREQLSQDFLSEWMNEWMNEWMIVKDDLKICGSEPATRSVL